VTLALADVVAELERRYDPRSAEPWDAVGLVCGDPDAPVERVHLAVDPVLAVADEAIAAGAQLLVTHHPLFLGGTTSVAATTAKGRVVHRLVSAGVGLMSRTRTPTSRRPVSVTPSPVRSDCATSRRSNPVPPKRPTSW